MYLCSTKEKIITTPKPYGNTDKPDNMTIKTTNKTTNYKTLIESCSIETLEALNKALTEATNEMLGECPFFDIILQDPIFKKMATLNTLVFKVIAKKTLNSMK